MAKRRAKKTPTKHDQVVVNPQVKRPLAGDSTLEETVSKIKAKYGVRT